MGDIIVVAVILLCVGLALRSIRKQAKNGGCCGDCQNCTGCRRKER